MQNLMELDYGWSTLDDDFIFRIVQILSSSQSPINVCRPATAILKKLVEADPAAAIGSGPGSSSKAPPPIPPPDSVYRYGFEAVHNQMRKEKALLETVVNRLGSAETAVVQHRCVHLHILPFFNVPNFWPTSMMLINSLLGHASDSRWEEFITSLEKLSISKAVIVRS
jgi:engulfment and cell motility protein 1